MTKIMVVDDDAALLTIMQLTFERAGYEVLTAENGLLALELAIQHQPRLVVLDDMMPARPAARSAAASRPTRVCRTSS